MNGTNLKTLCVKCRINKGFMVFPSSKEMAREWSKAIAVPGIAGGIKYFSKKKTAYLCKVSLLNDSIKV
jgi:hypothetical protein